MDCIENGIVGGKIALFTTDYRFLISGTVALCKFELDCGLGLSHLDFELDL